MSAAIGNRVLADLTTRRLCTVFHVLMQGHDMQIMEADGVEMEPFPVDLLTVAVAQRYSVLVEAKNASDTNYAMMAYQDPDM